MRAYNLSVSPAISLVFRPQLGEFRYITYFGYETL